MGRLSGGELVPAFTIDVGPASCIIRHGNSLSVRGVGIRRPHLPTVVLTEDPMGFFV